jgi:hypothetical protein
LHVGLVYSGIGKQGAARLRVFLQRFASGKTLEHGEPLSPAEEGTVLEEFNLWAQIPSAIVLAAALPSEELPSEELPSEELPSEELPSEELPSEKWKWTHG